MCLDVSLAYPRLGGWRPATGPAVDPSSSFSGSRPLGGGFAPGPAVDPRGLLGGEGLGTTSAPGAPSASPFGDINYAPTTVYTTILPPEDGGGGNLYIIIGLIALAGIVLFMVLK